MKYCILLASLLSSVVLANPPTSCPTVDNIKEVGLSTNLARDAYGHWFAGRTSQFYGTAHKWTFVIGDISARTKEEALASAYQALVTLAHLSGPFKSTSNKWLCLYTNDFQLPAGAITPPINALQDINLSM